ncbi:MAG: response regulator [Chryseolinea sp.]
MSPRLPIIAVVDDDKVFQFTTLRSIQAVKLSDNVLQFGNGEDALKYLRQNANESELLPDFIFLDINMPLVDGWMFLEDYAALKATIVKEICIFMVSSSIDPRDISRAKSNPNVADYITKPVRIERLVELLQKLA